MMRTRKRTGMVSAVFLVRCWLIVGVVLLAGSVTELEGFAVQEVVVSVTLSSPQPQLLLLRSPGIQIGHGRPTHPYSRGSRSGSSSNLCCPRLCGTTSTRIRSRANDDDDETTIRVGDLLSDLPTPTLLIELSLAETALRNANANANATAFGSLDEALALLSSSSSSSLFSDEQVQVPDFDFDFDGCVFVHTSVTDTSARDGITAEHGSGRSEIIGTVDAHATTHCPGGAHLGIGLANHHAGGYYWARGMGIGASLEAHGVAFRARGLLQQQQNDTEPDDVRLARRGRGRGGGGELYWERRQSLSSSRSVVCRGTTTDDSSNSNDGKRSEWADFLVEGDTVQLVPFDANRVLRTPLALSASSSTSSASFRRLVGVRRVGRPLGADPIVERIWERREAKRVLAPADDDRDDDDNDGDESSSESTPPPGWSWVPL